MICAIAGHKALAKTIWNDGTHFGKCSRCRLDLVEQEGRWTTPPPWLRVVWRRSEPASAPAVASEPEAAPEPAPEPQPEPVAIIEEPALEPPLVEAQPDQVKVADFVEERAGTERRAGRGRKGSAMGVERRRGGERRKRQKKQAIARD